MNDLDAKFFSIKAATVPVIVMHELTVQAEVRNEELVYTIKLAVNREGLRTTGYVGKCDGLPYLFIESLDTTKPMRIEDPHGGLIVFVNPSHMVCRRLAFAPEHANLPIRFEHEYHIVGS